MGVPRQELPSWDDLQILTAQLSRLSSEFAQKMAEAEEKAHEIAGTKFNLGSPKQIGEILFGEMGLPGGKKTKTGAWSTDVKVLEELAAQPNTAIKISRSV